MTKLARCAVLAAVVVLALALPAAAGIVDLNTNDANSITSQSGIPPQLTVNESYGEKYLVPYTSHDGLAIVNSGEWLPTLSRYFDKVVTGAYTQLIFKVDNNTPYIWSDYHFEFWNETFTERRHPVLNSFSDLIFNNEEYNQTDGILKFWAPNWQGIGQQNTYTLTFATVNDPLGIRQVATTPVPPAVWLFGSGLLGLAGWEYRRRKR